MRTLLLLALLTAAGAGGQQLPPYDYYVTTSNTTGATLKSTLHEIIKGHTVLPYFPEGETVAALSVLDQDPQNTSDVILIYSGFSVATNSFGGDPGQWNREHLWPQSYGIDTNNSDSTTAVSDLFNLRPCDVIVNGTRASLYYDSSTVPSNTLADAPGSSFDSDSWEPREVDKGAIARSMFYMAVRYDGTDPNVPDLDLGDTPNAGAYVFGKLSTLLAWNRRFPVTDAERIRNGLIYQTYQHNRNPFIDNPDFADMVFLGVDGFTAWQNTHFTEAELANATVAGATADPDEDGTSNLAEYAFGHDPRIAEASAVQSLTMQTAGGTNYLYITHHKNHYASGIAMGYETSTDFVSWTETAAETVNATQIDPQKDAVTVRIPVNTDAVFVRFKIHWPLL